jgi:hypothetical protein
MHSTSALTRTQTSRNPKNLLLCCCLGSAKIYLTMEHYGKPDWDQTLTMNRVNEEKKISETISGTEGIRKKIMITRR